MQNKIVFITGASSGIGAACAEHFAQMGAKLILCSRRLTLINELAAKLQLKYGVEIYPLQLDVRDSNQVKECFKTLPEAWKKIAILINNAGLAVGLERLYEGSTQDWEEMIDTNIKGLLYVTREIVPHMVAENAGHIINISSIAGHRVYTKGVVYCATKHAVNALSEGLRLDLVDTKVRVSTVSPGAVETNFSVVRFKGDTKRAAAVYQDMEPLTADDVADAVIYCATRKPHINVSEILIVPTDQMSITRVQQNK